MKYHSLLEDDLIDFSVIGIKTFPIQEFLLVFQINKDLNTQFTRKEDLDIKFKGETYSFIQYYFYQEETDTEFTLFSNLSISKEIKSKNSSLFEEISTQHLLINKLKRFNYLLKSNNSFNEDFLVLLSACKNIQQIERIEPLQNYNQIQYLIT